MIKCLVIVKAAMKITILKINLIESKNVEDFNELLFTQIVSMAYSIRKLN